MFSTPIGEHFYQDFALSSTDRKAEITLFGSPAQNITEETNFDHIEKNSVLKQSKGVLVEYDNGEGV